MNKQYLYKGNVNQFPKGIGLKAIFINILLGEK